MIILARHGDAVGTKGKFHGWVDNPLTLAGKEEAVELADILSKYKGQVESIYSSPLKRTTDTANEIAKKLGLTVTNSKPLIAWNLGDFVGKSVDKFLDNIKYYVNNPQVKVPNGESFLTFANRYLPFLEEHFNSDGNKIFVTHGRNIKLTHAWIVAGASGTKYDKATLLNNETTEHGGYAIADKPKKFELITPKTVKAGQS